MDTTKMDDGGVALAQQAAALAAELGIQQADAGPALPEVNQGTPAEILYKLPLPSGKKRAGYTTCKGQGMPKAKRRMATRSRRVNRSRR